jgi:hypothetical protein
MPYIHYIGSTNPLGEHIMRARTNFGAIPTGLSFTFPKSKRVWFVSNDGRAFSFESDNETKQWVTPKFAEPVICLNAR